MGWKKTVTGMKPGTIVDVHWYDIAEWSIAPDEPKKQVPKIDVHTYRLANPKWVKVKEGVRFLRLTTGKATDQPGLCLIPEGCIVNVTKAR